MLFIDWPHKQSKFRVEGNLVVGRQCASWWNGSFASDFLWVLNKSFSCWGVKTNCCRVCCEAVGLEALSFPTFGASSPLPRGWTAGALEAVRPPACWGRRRAQRAPGSSRFCTRCPRWAAGLCPLPPGDTRQTCGRSQSVSLVFSGALVTIEHEKQFCVLSFTGYEDPVIFHAALLLVKRERRMEGEDGF